MLNIDEILVGFSCDQKPSSKQTVAGWYAKYPVMTVFIWKTLYTCIRKYNCTKHHRDGFKSSCSLDLQ